MKKFVSLLTALLLLVTLAVPTFAAEDDDAYALYRSCMRKMEKVTSMGLKGTMDYTFTIEDVSISVPIEFDAEQVLQSDGTVDMRMTGKVDGGSFLYYGKGDYLYTINDEGKKIKSKSGMESIMEVLNNTDMDFVKGDLEDAVVTHLDNGDTRIQFSIEGAALSEATNQVYDVMDLDATADFGSAVNYSITIDSEGYLKSMKAAARVVLEVEDLEMEMIYRTSMRIHSIDRPLEIGFPSDLNLYVEVSSL